MNCKKCEEQIFLFRELTREEQGLVESHVANCASCKALLESMKGITSQIELARVVIHELPDPARLTENIMGEVRRNKQRSWNLPTIHLSDFSFQYIRYAMATASIVFIVFLGMELLNGPVQSEKQIVQNEPRPIVLDRGKFQLGLRNSKKSKRNLLMSGCANPFRPQEVTEDCFRQKLAVLRAL